jgi:iron complex transport system permease protein
MFKKWVLISLLMTLSTLSVFVGVQDLSILDLFRLDESKIQVLTISRLPRLISIIITGFGMSISGLIMQQISRNKFVSPTTAATVDSAKLGILVSFILFTGANVFYKMLISFAFSLAGTFLFMWLLKSIKFKNVIFVPLLGIMLGTLIDSITTFFAYRFDLIQSINSMMVGSFSLIIKGRYELLYISIPLVIIAFLYANRFSVAGMGEDFSKSLGLNYHQIVQIGLVIVALISATVVITIGSVPFLGLIIPNIVSIYNGDHLRKNILETGLFGALFLLVCDLFSRLIIYPYEVPIGLTVGVIGSVVFLVLLFRGASHEK